MMFIDTYPLLEAIHGPEPAGPNLEYAPEFAELERAALGVPEQQMGASTLPAQAPDDERVRSLATALLARSKDLRAAMHLLAALLARAGLPGFIEGLHLIRGLLERYWDGVHPRGPLADDPECEARRNALALLGKRELVRKLEHCTLFVCPARGPLTVEDVASAGAASSDIDPARRELVQRVVASFAASQPSELGRLLQALTQAGDDLAAIGGAFHERGLRAPDTELLGALIASSCRSLRISLSAPAESGVGDPSAQPSASAPGASAPPPPGRARIRGREDALSLLEEIRAYYVQHEPSSPLPLLLERCQRLATLDFMALIGDLAPEALGKLEIVAGIKRA